jgi:hypothetical protein
MQDPECRLDFVPDVIAAGLTNRINCGIILVDLVGFGVLKGITSR